MRGKICVIRKLILIFTILLISSICVCAQNYESVNSRHLNQKTSLTFYFGTYNIKYYDQQKLWEEYPEAKFNLYFNIGSEFGNDINGFSLDVKPGVRFNRYIFAGIESGISLPVKTEIIDAGAFSVRLRSEMGYVPVAANIKGLYPIGKTICPYVEASLGGFFGIQTIKGTNGLYLKLGAGIEFARFSFSAGYKFLSSNKMDMNYGYLKVGYRIGR